jgi:hypothetical protein
MQTGAPRRRLRRMVRCSLRCALVAALVSLPLAAQVPTRLDEATLRALRERMGGDPFVALARWVKDAAEPQPAWLPTRDDPADDAMHALIHAALAADEPDVAYAAACLVREHELDLAGIDRWLAAVTPHLFDENPRWDWDTWKHIVSTADVHRVLQPRDVWHAEIRYFYLNDLHRSFRPEHLPAVARLTHHEDPFVRKQAVENVLLLAGWTDRHFEAVAETLLGWPGPDDHIVVDQDDRSRNPVHVPRPFSLPTPRPGWSPLLRAALQRCFLDFGEGKNAAPAWPFLMRRAEAETPGEEDRLLLGALLTGTNPHGVDLALRTLCRLEPDVWLQRLLDPPPKDAELPLVLAARRDWPALRELATQDEDALAAALEFDFEGTWLPWVATAFGADAAQGLAAIELLAEADEPRPAPFRRPPGLAERLAQANDLFAARLDHARLHQLVVRFPLACTTKLAQHYLDSITPANLAASAVEVLEVADDEALLRRLRSWAESPDPAVHGPALDVLLRLGDTEAGERLVARWRDTGDTGAKDRFLLARAGRAAAVRAALDQDLRLVAWSADGALDDGDFATLAAAAMAHGLPGSVARSWANRCARGDRQPDAKLHAAFPALREHVLADRPVDALLASLAHAPLRGIQLTDLGLVDDDRVRDLLQRVRNTPGADVQWAIAELALAGDRTAQREMAEVRTRHLYGWLDDATQNGITQGRSLDLAPWLIGEIETVCCRRNMAVGALEDLTGFDASAQPEAGLVTQHEYARRWWQAAEHRLRWSELAQRFVVAPR